MHIYKHTRYVYTYIYTFLCILVGICYNFFFIIIIIILSDSQVKTQGFKRLDYVFSHTAVSRTLWT